MPGGPVNGVPLTGMLSLVGGAGIASAARRGSDPNAPENTTGIIVPTVLQMAADALNYWTSLTCLYDRYWEADPDKVTLPICMFHVKKIAPTRTVEYSLSKKEIRTARVLWTMVGGKIAYQATSGDGTSFPS